MKIAIDFDGTIVKHRFPEIGEPIQNVFYWLNLFIEHGAELYLFTMRSDDRPDGRNYLTEAVEYLNKMGIVLHGIQADPTQHKWTSSPKCYAHVYIDDDAFGCPLIHPADGSRPYVAWGLVGPRVLKMIKENITPGIHISESKSQSKS